MNTKTFDDPFTFTHAVQFVRIQCLEDSVYVWFRHDKPDRPETLEVPLWLPQPNVSVLPKELISAGTAWLAEKMRLGLLPYTDGRDNTPLYANPGNWLVKGQYTDPINMHYRQGRVYQLKPDTFQYLLDTGSIPTPH